jgi:parallel beta-helix repeat protein
VRLSAVAVIALAVLIAAAPAGARSIQVRPGEDAIAQALRRAEPGDSLRLHQGRYRESVEINKRVSLVGVPGEPRPVIDARCRTGETIAVRAGGVTLRRLRVVGADEGFGVAPSAVTFVGVSNGEARGLHLRDTCDAEYGINVFDTGPVLIDDSRATGYSDAGFYVGSITATPGGTIRVRDSDAVRNNRGVIVEETEPGHVAVSRNFLARNRAPGHGPPTGIWLHLADGVRIIENAIQGNGEYGVHLDPDSDDNRLVRNEGRGNPVDLFNEGTGNCGRENLFETAEGQALTAC